MRKFFKFIRFVNSKKNDSRPRYASAYEAEWVRCPGGGTQNLLVIVTVLSPKEVIEMLPALKGKKAMKEYVSELYLS